MLSAVLVYLRFESSSYKLHFMCDGHGDIEASFVH